VKFEGIRNDQRAAFELPLDSILPPLAAPAKSITAMAKIQFTTPEGQTGEVELSSERLSLGRADDNSIQIVHDSISSHHGEFAFDGSAWTFTDLGSTNGTSVSGQRVEALEMANGGAFQIGHVEVVFYGDYADDSAAYAPATQTISHTGYGATPIDRSSRSGFGPKAKPKSHGYGPLYALGFIALGACGYAVFTFLNLSA
jgi:pSer/pThr/pTyr-binding forkhead associated (FHA) protein